MKEPKRIRDFPLYDRNPWDPDGIYERIKESGGQEKIVTDENGEVFVLKTAIKMKGKIMKDYLSYRKLYKDNLDKVKNLTIPGLRLFCYILLEIGMNVDEIRIDTDKAKEFCEYSSMSQYYSGLTDLLENGFLVRKADDRMVYFINVNIFFNGDRGKMLMDKENKEI